MALLIDPPVWPAYGRLWSHLVSDTSIEELHAFAVAAGIPRRVFEGDHYDIPQERYDEVVAAGALPVGGKELLSRLRDSGLRLQKRRGDRGITRALGVTLAGATADVDLVASDRELDRDRVMASCVFVRDALGSFLLVHSSRREEWGPPGGWREQETARQAAVRELAEETGLVADPQMLVPRAYERFRPRPGNEPWHPTREAMQVYSLDLDVERPPLQHTDAGISAVRWATPAEFTRLCGGLFWWPVAEYLFHPAV